MTIEDEQIKMVNDKCKGKVVKEIKDYDGCDELLDIVFTDGSKLQIHYDWIYDLYYEGDKT
jgi:hypothetical protein